MLGSALRQVVERGDTTVREISAVTGRGESTVYRWLSAQSMPDVDDFVQLLARLRSQDARRALLAALLSDVPVTADWVDADPPDAPTTADALRQATDVSMQSLRWVVDLLAEERQFTKDDGLTPDQCAEMAMKVSTIMDQMVRVRVLLCGPAMARRQKAR